MCFFFQMKKMKCKKKLAVLIFWLIFVTWRGPIAFGQTLSDYVQWAIENSATSKKEQIEEEIAGAQKEIVGHFDPMTFGGGYGSSFPSGALFVRGAYLSAKQDFPWPGTFHTQKKISDLDIKISQNKVLQGHLQTALQVKELYYKLFAFSAVSRLLKDNKDILETYEDMATRALEYHRTDISTVLALQARKNALHNRAYRDFNLFLSLSRNLNRILNRPLDSDLFIPDSLSVLDIRPYVGSLSEHHPELEEWQLEQKKSAMQKELAKVLYNRPSFSLSANLGVLGIDPSNIVGISGRYWGGVSFGLNYPVLDSKYKSRKRLSDLRGKYAAQATTVRRQELEGELDLYTTYLNNAIIQVVGAQKNAALIRRSINAILRPIEKTRINYGMLLKLQLEWLNYRILEIEGTRDAYLYKARIDFLLGRV